ncbi:AraC family transcriptional regulator [Ameyamaea chiangmaiensis NBRC 103196]|uniref:GlxA family transcriptional regulator n=1 Tax=Ameyamaea chiangmaiensis TaxID=442969 RepID=A0A850P8V9_9PROT|nr:GlxA family transcriptional regulator [Ameyamaea chiangmaiensis]MBS4076075.1 GlxA family transcriptional regulator [Ameyamaea chiangmaiensis]NVN41017.1 GlxA family transcriptional regulator [Ameyamaea chiangmaiensis]GBQ66918.1 AraC family transcriptional regulator [Ameyamaea chiangmaiensis NBRC 103196]
MSEGASGETKPRLRVGFILAEHFTLSAFALFVDHLRLAADKDDRSRPIHCSWQVLSSSVHPVRSSCGVAIARDASLGDPRAFDYIVVVGGLLYGQKQIDYVTAIWLRRAAEMGITLVGVCTGTFALCQAGLMENRRVCVSWYHHQDFQDAFPAHEAVSDQMFLDDGDRITCSGGGAASDVALHLIERSIGRPAGQKASHILLMERAGKISNQIRLQPQPPTLASETRFADPRVRRAVLHMEQNMTRPLPITQLAARLGISSRQLERLFQTALGRKPQDFYRSLRLRHARALLEAGEMSVTEVAIEMGFSDCSHFSRHFKTLFGISPSACHRTPLPDFARPHAAPEMLSHVGIRLFSNQ